MSNIKFDYSKAEKFLAKREVEAMQPFVDVAHDLLHEGRSLGNDYIGWIDLPVNYDKDEFARIKKAADKIKSDSEILVVIGIGGSYLGAKAAIEMLGKNFKNNLSKEERQAPEIYFAGNSISSSYLLDLLDLVKDRDYSVNVISKSGTTTEPALPLEFSRKTWKRGMVRKKQPRGYMQLQMPRGGLLGVWLRQKVMKHL